MSFFIILLIVILEKQIYIEPNNFLSILLNIYSKYIY